MLAERLLDLLNAVLCWHNTSVTGMKNSLVCPIKISFGDGGIDEGDLSLLNNRLKRKDADGRESRNMA